VTSPGLADSIRLAAGDSTGVNSQIELGDCRVALLRMFGTLAGVAYRPDRVEVERRRVGRSGALTRLDVLDVLMGLPVGLPVARKDLTATERTLVAGAVAGAVEGHDGLIVRRAVAPVSVRFAVVAARDWRVGLERAGRFAPFCARAMLLPALPADWDDAQTQASYFGIGMCVFVDTHLRMPVQPAPHVRERHTPAQWWFAEEAYRQISECGSLDGPAGSTKTRERVRPRP
jgi:hypothetical protein